MTEIFETNIHKRVNFDIPYLVKLSLARMEFLAPEEFKLETGRLLTLLSNRPEGIEKDALIREFYQQFDSASPMRQMCLVACLNKIIQRARQRFSRFGLTIEFCKREKIWLLMPVEFTRENAPLRGYGRKTFTRPVAETKLERRLESEDNQKQSTH